MGSPFTFFDRSYELSFGGAPVSGLQVSFDVTLSSGKAPNLMALTIYNTSADTRGKLIEDVEATLAVGWDGDIPSVIFSGQIVKISHVRDGTDWRSSIEASDGNAAFRRQATLTMGAGVTLKDVVRSLLVEIDLDPGDIVNKISDKGAAEGIRDFARGYVTIGKPLDNLATLCRSIKLNLSIQEGRLVVLEDTESVPGGAIELSKSSGLIGTPEPGEKGIVRCTSLMNPRIKPGKLVNLSALAVEGDFKVLKANHLGSFRENDWYTNMELRPL